MDEKEAIIFSHYKRLIESRGFNEYDILGFLIFIRRHIKNEFPNIRDWADLIAHRERDRGFIFDNSKRVAKMGYRIDEESNKILGYDGVPEEVWKNEWYALGESFEIMITDDIIRDLMVCFFSLSQFATYKSRDDQKNKSKDDQKIIGGRLDLFMMKSGDLALVTSERNTGAVSGVYTRYGKYKFVNYPSGGCIGKPVEALRINGEIRLIEGNTQYI